MTTTIISCTIGTTNPSVALGFEVWLDDQQVYNTDHIMEDVPLNITVDDTVEGEHELKFILKNKLPEHTKIDDGNIISDAMVTVSNLRFDDIEILPIVTNSAVYRHNFNNTGEEKEDTFYGNMGCNGVASLKFTTPIYLWLLANL